MATSNNGHSADGHRDVFPIAVVGIGCRMPGDVNSPEDFWRVIRDGRDVVDDILPERWNVEHYHHPDHTRPGKHCMRRIGMIRDIEKFDNSFFKISPREAVSMDPQQRHLLEVTQEAFEDAGIIPDELGAECGVFVGIGLFDYSIYITDPYLMDAYVLTGNAHSCAANRLSFAFNLKGPSLACDTACASGLTALHLAASALWAGECGTAVVGACNAVLIPEVAIGFSQLGVVSADGVSRPFSAEASGYVRSEGWGALILKPLASAVRDGDHVYCTLVASGAAANGRHNSSLTMPSPDAQHRVMAATYDRFGIDRAGVDYVEAHGTGTPVGDPVEANAIGLTFAPYRDKPLKIGSVKSNFGHQECCSGIASAIKVCLMLDRKTLCPTINLQGGVNPEIDLRALKLEIQRTLEPIAPGHFGFTVGLNSFGFAGALAHAVFREAPAEDRGVSPGGSQPPQRAGWRFGGASAGEYLLVPLTARSADAVADLARLWLDFEHENDALSVTSWLATRRKHFECRLAVVANSSGMFRERLRAHADGRAGEGVHAGTRYGADSSPGICFVFPGQGQQWAGMGRRLYHTEATFRRAVEECDRHFRRLSGWSLLADKKVFNGVNSSRKGDVPDDVIDEMEVSQPAIVFLQIGLCELLCQWGVKPVACVGHSLGEIAAAYACGALNLEEAVAVVYHRSRQQAMIKGTGGMAAVRLPLPEVRELCDAHGNLHVAAVNSPLSTTVSGDVAAVRRLCAEHPSSAKELRVQCAFHSPDMDPLEAPFREAMSGVIAAEGRRAGVPLYSSALGGRHEGDLSADFWWRTIRGRVDFQDAVERLLDETRPGIFLEIAASATLISAVNQITQARRLDRVTGIGCGRRGRDDRASLLNALAGLYTSGVKLDWRSLTHDAGRWLRLPAYPWQRKPFWMEAEHKRNTRLLPEGVTFKSANGRLSLEEFPHLSDHVVRGKTVFPGAGYIDYIAQTCLPTGQPSVLRKIRFVKVLTWPEKPKAPGEKTTVQLDLDRKGTVVEVRGDGQPVCRAEIDDATPVQRKSLSLPLGDILRACPVDIDAADLYASLAEMGLDYGPSFRPIERVRAGDWEAVGYLRPIRAAGHRVDVPTLDGCFQLLLAAVGRTTSSYLPVRVDRFEMLASSVPVGLPLLAHAKIADRDSFTLTGDVSLADREGVLLAKATGCQFRSVGGGARTEVDLNSCLYVTEWMPAASRLPDTGLLRDVFREEHLRERFPEEMRAVDAGEESLGLLRRASLAYIRRALREVPPRERGVNERYSRRLESLSESGEESLPLDEIPACLEDISGRASELRIECDMIRALGENLPRCLRNPLSSLNLLFSFLGEYFRSASSINVFTGAVVELLTRAVLELSQTKKVIRILEVGARTGCFAGALLQSLREAGLAGGRLRYAFTDASRTFFPEARASLADYHPSVRYDVLDVQRDPEAQGFVPGSVDVVVCLDSLHAAADLDDAARNLASLICEGGWLLVVETTRGNCCQELIFGCLELCWRFADFRTESCWMPAEGWAALLGRSGFEGIVGCSTPNEYFHSVILGRKPRGQGQSELATSPSSPTTVSPSRYRWVLVSDESQHSLNQRLCRCLGPPDHHFSHSPDSSYSNALSQNCQSHRPDVVYIWSEEDSGIHCLLMLLRAVARRPKAVSRVWVVTEGASVECRVPMAQLAVGFARAACNQLPTPLISVDLDPSRSAEDNALCLVALILSPTTPEREIALRDGETKVPRILSLISEGESDPSPGNNRRYWCLEMSREDLPCSSDDKGAPSKDNVGFAYRSELSIGADEVLVEVRASGLNFKDVMTALGMLDGLGARGEGAEELGLECAGIVRDVGAEVTALSPGDEVLGFGARCLASHAVCRAAFLARKPRRLPWAEAGGLAVAFVTARYCLERKAMLRSGETVLIHSACGAVGLAAVQVARALGAEVIATAGTAEKRRHLEEVAGVRRVSDSRSDRFYADVMRWTAGQGVDVVLNSLAGGLLAKGVALLKPEGRFCEIGKRDILRNAALQMNPLLYNVSFLSCQIDMLMRSNPGLVSGLLREVVDLVKSRELEPVLTRAYEISDFAEAFGLASRGIHVGKIVFEVGPGFRVPPALTIPSSGLFKSTATYLVSGGHGGLGQALARWLAAAGARHIALVSRRGAAGAASRSAVRRLQSTGVRVHQLRCDLSDRRAVSAMLDELRRTAPPLGGVFHLAGQIRDESLEEADLSDLDAVVGSKASAALYLHDLTLSDDLDHFVLVSSVTAAWGHAAQPGYAAANACLDALAVHRRRRGLPALSIQLGPVRGAGHLEERPETARIFASKGNRSLHVLEFLEVLQRLLETGSQTAVVCLANQDWATTLQFCHRHSLRFRHLAEACRAAGAEDPNPTRGGGPSSLDAEGALRAKLAELLFVPAESVDVGQPLIDYGVDSLMAVELVSWAGRVLGVPVSQLDVLSGLTAADLLAKAPYSV